jgi:Divergent InlB B-repeat domain
MNRAARQQGWFVALIAVALMVVPGLLAGASPSSAPVAGPPPPPTGNVDVTQGVATFPIPINSSFWGATVTPYTRLLPNDAALFNATPTKMIVWPGAQSGDEYDPIHNVIWTENGSGWQSHTPQTNESTFVSWCESINCNATFQVPAENNNATLAAEVVNYTINTLHFWPKYWEIGNEPALWTHFDEGWANWSKSDNNTITAAGYARLVHRFIAAMEAVVVTSSGLPYSNASIIGLPGIGRGSTDSEANWIGDTVSLNGPELAGVAIHEYPAANVNTPVSLYYFYNKLQGPSGVPAKIWDMDNWTKAGIANTSGQCAIQKDPCDQIAPFETEIGSALAHQGYKIYSPMFSGALDMAAQMTQAMSASARHQIASIDLYASVLNTNNSWFSGNGTSRPVYTLYTQILDRLGSTAYNVTLGNNLSSTVYAIATSSPQAGGKDDLLVVNLNLSNSITFAPEFPGNISASSYAVNAWAWNAAYNSAENKTGEAVLNASSPGPLSSFYPDNLTSVTVPAQGMLLLEAYTTTAGEPVRFTEQNLTLTANASTFWTMTVGGRETASNLTNVTDFLPVGQYNISVGSFYNNKLTHLERDGVNTPSILYVNQTTQLPVSYTLTFSEQWSVQLTASPSNGGSFSSDSGWYSVGSPINVTAIPAQGYVFSRWYGKPFNNTSAPTITGYANESYEEKGVFLPVAEVYLNETGLPDGTAWTILLSNTTYLSSTGPSLEMVEPSNRTYGFHVEPVSGYRSTPTNSSITVQGSLATKTIAFTHLYEPPTRYAVTFSESGLPTGTAWSVTMSNTTAPAVGSNVTFEEVNGTHWFRVGNVTGFVAQPAYGLADVVGTSLFLTIVFAPYVPYAVTFTETGLPTGTPWTVTVSNVSESSGLPELTFDEVNGTHFFRVANMTGFKAVPAFDHIDVAGTELSIGVAFSPYIPYSVQFVEAGLPEGTPWSVEVKNVTYGASTSAIQFTEYNGVYGFQIFPPVGFGAHVASYTFTVNFGPVNFQVAFSPLVYRQSWSESGLGATPNWGVVVSGLLPQNSTRSWINVNLTNGSYDFRVLAPQGYRAIPSSGTISVVGEESVTRILFQRYTYGVTFIESGLPAGTYGWVHFAGAVLQLSDTIASFQIYNGTFAFTVVAPHGYTATPRVGEVTVNGSGDPTVGVAFAPTSDTPIIPSVWVVGASAVTVLGVLILAAVGTFAALGAVRRARPGAPP